jgi:hypothetical protein
MGKKKYRETERRSRNTASKVSKKHWRAWWLVAVGLMVVIAGIIAARLAGKSNNQAGSKQAIVNSDTNPLLEPASGDTAWDPSWPSLPGSDQPARPIEVVYQAYAYAARRGDVLQYMPCYCGCERQGHRSNRDCFVKSMTTTGKPQWDPMGYT